MTTRHAAAITATAVVVFLTMNVAETAAFSNCHSGLSSTKTMPAFSINHHLKRSLHNQHPSFSSSSPQESLSLLHAAKEEEEEDTGKRFAAASVEKTQINIRTGAIEENAAEESSSGGAAINTVNERLMAEIKAAANQEKYGKNVVDDDGKTRPNPFFTKSEQERQRSIEEARDLNGINPLVAIGGALFAFAGAYGLWTFTNFLAVFFGSHPVTTDVYTLQRISAVFRNVVMGLTSLASGFFGVTGLGIFLLGVRVAYGVSTGELDPTPIKKNTSDEIVLPNVWELMMGKKPNKRGR